jgi:8-oxo-dGTP pyrophosphatase MutT (NUDIX family)
MGGFKHANMKRNAEQHMPTIESIAHPLEEILKGSKPGFDAQLEMSPEPRPGTRPVDEIEDTYTRAGVLILLYPKEGRPHIVLTLRTHGMEYHQGQISLPGGRQEPGESLEQTALRETQEELSVDIESLKVIGAITPLYIPPSRYCIYPYVAFSERRPVFQPSPLEVAEVIEVPLYHLTDSNNAKKELWIVRGIEMTVPFYAFGDYKIWGATAMVLAEFLAVIEKTLSTLD